MKFYKIIFSLSLVIFSFIAVDTYFIPFKCVTDVVKSKDFYTLGRNYNTTRTYTLVAGGKKFDIPNSLNKVISIGDTINVFSSVLTNSVQKVSFHREDNLYTFEVGYTRGNLSFNIFLFAGIILIIFFIFPYRKNSLQYRRTIVFFIFIYSIIQLFFHLR